MINIRTRYPLSIQRLHYRIRVVF